VFDEGDAVEIEVARADGERFVLRRADDAWTLVDSGTSPNQELVDRFVEDLRGLKGYEIAADTPEDLGKYGLASPSLTITVRGKDSTLGIARFGSYEPEPPATEYTAQRDGEPTVFHVREYEFARLDKSKGDFLPKPTAAPVQEDAAQSEEAADQ